MHESIAKALVKGDLRSARTQFDNNQLFWEKKASSNANGTNSKKQLLQFIGDLYSCPKKLLIAHVESKSRSSWHKKILHIEVSHNPTLVEGVGELYGISIMHSNTRACLKGKTQDAYRPYSNELCVHAHFLQRLTQRTSENERAKINQALLVAMFGVKKHLKKVRPISFTETETYHVVAGEIVIISTYHHKNKIVVFNTVLLKSRFTENQKQFYGKIEHEIKLNGSRYGVYSEKSGETVCFPENLNNYEILYQYCEDLFKRLDRAELGL